MVWWKDALNGGIDWDNDGDIDSRDRTLGWEYDEMARAERERIASMEDDDDFFVGLDDDEDEEDDDYWGSEDEDEDYLSDSFEDEDGYSYYPYASYVPSERINSRVNGVFSKSEAIEENTKESAKESAKENTEENAVNKELLIARLNRCLCARAIELCTCSIDEYSFCRFT